MKLKNANYMSSLSTEMDKMEGTVDGRRVFGKLIFKKVSARSYYALRNMKNTALAN